MQVVVDVSFIYILMSLIFIFFGVGFILPLLLGGKPARLFFSAKLRRNPVFLVTRPEKTIADVWKGEIAKKQYGLYRIYPDAVYDFHGVRLAIADALTNRILPASVMKIIELARKKGYKNVNEFLDDVKKKAGETGYNPAVDYIYIDPPDIKLTKAEDVESHKLNGEAIRISDIEKMFEAGDPSAFLMELQNKYIARELLERDKTLTHYAGLMMVIVGFFIGLVILLNALKGMGLLTFLIKTVI